MHTFHQIVQYLYLNNSVILDGTFEKNLELINLSRRSHVLNEQKYAEYVFITFVLNNDYSYKNKFALLKNACFSPFFPNDFREHFFVIFSKLQSIYHRLNRFAFCYKFKKAKTQITTDVYLNPIVCNDKNVVTIYQNQHKYLFTATDLINIINTSLGNTSHLFCEPLIIKNPYTNMPFGKSILYSIYFFIKSSSLIMPLLFHHFFVCNFNLKQFLIDNEPLLRDYAIEEYLKKTSNSDLAKIIRSMLRRNYYGKKLYINKGFPDDILINVMKPHLRLFYFGRYCLNITKRTSYKIKWKIGLRQFVKSNPTFGKKRIVRNMFSIPSRQIEYDTYVKEVNDDCEEESFMDNHLSQYCDEDDRYSISSEEQNYESDDYDYYEESSDNEY